MKEAAVHENEATTKNLLSLNLKIHISVAILWTTTTTTTTHRPPIYIHEVRNSNKKSFLHQKARKKW